MQFDWRIEGNSTKKQNKLKTVNPLKAAVGGFGVSVGPFVVLAKHKRLFWVLPCNVGFH